MSRPGTFLITFIQFCIAIVICLLSHPSQAQSADATKRDVPPSSSNVVTEANSTAVTDVNTVTQEQNLKEAADEPEVLPNRDDIIMDVSNEIAILKKTAEKRREGREKMLRETEEIYKKFQTEVQDMATVLYALDDQKTFTLAFYCKKASRLVRLYREEVPSFEKQLKRAANDIQRIDKIILSLEENDNNTLSPKALKCKEEALETCYELKETLQEREMQINQQKAKFDLLTSKINKLSEESDKLFNSLFNKIFYNHSDIAKFIFTHPGSLIDFSIAAWKSSSDSKFQIPSDSATLKHYSTILLILAFCSYWVARFIVCFCFRKTLQKSNAYEKRFAYTNVTTILLMAIFLLASGWYTDLFLLQSATSLGAEFLLLVSGILFSVVTRFRYGAINAGVRIYMPYLFLAGSFMFLRMFMAPDIIVELAMPILFTFVSLVSIITWLRQRKKLPGLDRFFASVSLGMTVLGSAISWYGLSFMAFLVLMVWIMLMSGILLLVGIWDTLHHYEVLRKESNKKEIPWFRPFVSKFVLPCLTVFIILFSLYWPAAIFDMGDLIIAGIMEKTEIKDLLTFSWFGLIEVILLAITVNYLISIGKNTLREIYGEDYETGTIPTIITLSTLIIWSIFLIAAFVILKANYSGLLAIMGGLSLGVGLALKDTIENIISGLSLMFGRLRQGDMIECDGYRGRVASLGYRSTMIETTDGSVIAFQNSQLFNKNFRNMTRNHKFELGKVEIGIAYGTDVDLARQIIMEAVEELPFLSKVKKTSVVLDNFGDNSVNLIVYVWVPVLTRSRHLSVVRECIYKAFNENNISIPFPQQDVYIKEIPANTVAPLSVSNPT